VITSILVVAGTITVVAGMSVYLEWQLRRLAANRRRAGESICQFARSFPRRSTDFRVVRAVYEGISTYLTHDPSRFPVRATDSCTRTFYMDDDDLEDLGLGLLRRCGRSSDGLEQNPYARRVWTVQDLVAFISHQPRQDAA
jgi:hypothetical protein